eukprot:scaffold5717_cov112-Isochrysis_galbana.AAC.12
MRPSEVTQWRKLASRASSSPLRLNTHSCTARRCRSSNEASPGLSESSSCARAMTECTFAMKASSCTATSPTSSANISSRRSMSSTTTRHSRSALNRAASASHFAARDSACRSAARRRTTSAFSRHAGARKLRPCLCAHPLAVLRLRRSVAEAGRLLLRFTQPLRRQSEHRLGLDSCSCAESVAPPAPERKENRHDGALALQLLTQL